MHDCPDDPSARSALGDVEADSISETDGNSHRTGPLIESRDASARSSKEASSSHDRHHIRCVIRSLSGRVEAELSNKLISSSDSRSRVYGPVDSDDGAIALNVDMSRVVGGCSGGVVEEVSAHGFELLVFIGLGVVDSESLEVPTKDPEH